MTSSGHYKPEQIFTSSSKWIWRFFMSVLMIDQSTDPFHCHNGLIWQVCENLNEHQRSEIWGSHRAKTTVVQILLTTSVECKEFRKISVRFQKLFEVLNQMRYTWCCYRKSKFLLTPFHHFSDYLSVEHGRQFTLEMTNTGHYSSRQAKYRILLLQRTPSGALFVLMCSCIMVFLRYSVSIWQITVHKADDIGSRIAESCPADTWILSNQGEVPSNLKQFERSQW